MTESVVQTSSAPVTHVGLDEAGNRQEQGMIGGAAKVSLSSSSVTPPSEKFYTDWILGGLSSTVTVTSNTSQAAGAQDMTLYNRDNGVLKFDVASGNGTCTIKAVGSPTGDGTNETASWDIATGIVTANGVQSFPLNDATDFPAYNNFLTFTVTETADGGDVEVKIWVEARGG